MELNLRIVYTLPYDDKDKQPVVCFSCAVKRAHEGIFVWTEIVDKPHEREDPGTCDDCGRPW
jgi:hypothetical protein